MSPDIGRDGKYDCTILDSSGNEIGLILTRDKDRSLNYMETTDTALAQQYFSGTPGYANLQPEKEWRGGQDDWRSGFGQEYYDNSDPLRYYESFNVDARFKGMAICGPKASSIALVDYSGSITDGELEIWTNSTTLTNWGETGSATLTRETGTIHGGTYSAKFTGGSDGKVQQSLTLTKYTDIKVVVKVWAHIDSVVDTLAKLEVYDGVGTTTASITGAGAWEQITVTRTTDSSADQLTIRLFYDYAGTSRSVYFDDVTWAAPFLGKPVCMADFNDERYMAYGDVLVKQNSGGNGWTFVNNFGVTITWLFAYSDNNLYVCLGNTAAKYYYMNTSESFTQSTLGDGYAYWMSAVGDVVYKVVQAKELKTAVGNDPTNAGSWSTATSVGASAENITFQVLDQAGTPVIMKEDMPYYIDSDGNVQRLITSLISEKASDSGKNAIVYKGAVYIPCGAQGLYEYSSTGVTTDISPAKYITNSANFDGQIQALAADSQYLYAFLDNSTKTEILAGRRETISGSTTWVWHPIAEVTITGVEFAGASTEYARRVWFLSTSSGDNVFYVPYPQAYGNITADSSYSFQTGGNIVTSWLHAGFKADKKAFYKITLTMSDTTANIYWEAHYQKLGDSGWTDIGDFKTSPTTEKYLPVDGSANEPESTMMRFKFVPVTNSTSSTPVLLGYDVRAVWYPKQREIILLQVKMADNLILHDDLPEETQTQLSRRTIISELANPTTAWPRKFYPPYYETSTDTKYVKLLPPAQYRQVKNEITRNPEWVYDLQLLIVDGLTF